RLLRGSRRPSLGGRLESAADLGRLKGGASRSEGTLERASQPPCLDPLHDAFANRGTAFDVAEREALGLMGRLPPRVESLDEQVARVLDVVRSKSTPLERHAYLAAVRDENETLFHRTVIDHIEELLPI